MSDDLTKKYKDKDTVSGQEWELRDMADRLGVDLDDVVKAKNILKTASSEDIKNYIKNHR